MEEIDLEIDQVELDHLPSISQLKFNTWERLEKDFLKNSSLFEVIETAYATVEYRLLHKQCNQLLGKESKRLADERIRELKKKYSPELFKKFMEFSTRIKKIRNLNQKQLHKILQQIRLFK